MRSRHLSHIYSRSDDGEELPWLPRTPATKAERYSYSRYSLAASPIHRAVTILGGMALFGPAFAIWSAIIQVPMVGVISPLLFAAVLALLVAAAVTHSERALVRIDLALLGLGVVALVAWTVTALYTSPAYGTDEAAFTQYAAQMLLHGVNPYGRNLVSALTQFQVPVQYATYTLSGGIVSSLGYPALDVLIAALFVWLTHGFQSIVIASVAALAITAVITFVVLPRRLRGLAVVLTIGLPILFGYALAGVSVIPMLPFLLIVAYKWTSVGMDGKLSKGDWVRAICLGAAVSIQQLAWFIAPFVIVAIWMLRRRDVGPAKALRIVATYSALAGATFLLINAPFIVRAPIVWLRAIFAPLTQHAIPYGQGLVDATIFFRLGGGDLTLFTIAGLMLYFALLAAFALNFSKLALATFILPTLPLFVPTRSLAEYFMPLIAVWTVSIATLDRSAGQPAYTSRRFPPRSTRRRQLLTAGLFVPAAAFVCAALAVPAPLSLRIQSMTSNGQFQRVWQLKVQVTNRSGNTLTPHFATNYIGQMTTFWNVISGPNALAPHRQATYQLAAPNAGSMPGITTSFVLQAVTPNPPTISSSTQYISQKFTCYLKPSYVNAPLHLRQSVVLRAELRSPFGARIEMPGVPIALGQVIYSQNALLPGEAQINHGNTGQTPVIALTDASGVATFHIRDSYAQGEPLYFQAWVMPSSGLPYGYSEIVSVLWR